MRLSQALAVLPLLAVDCVLAAPSKQPVKLSAPKPRSGCPRPPSSPPPLNVLARAAGKDFFGTASDIPGPEQDNAAYMAILEDNKIFGQLTPANGMKVRS